MTSLGWYAFVHDFVDEGVDDVIDRLVSTGADRVNLAVTYHTARDLVPHNPARAVRFLPGGSHHTAPDMGWYADGIRPTVDPQLDGTELTGSILPALANRGLGFDAWVVTCHNSRLGSARPELAQRNAFGDPMLTDLCPANPAVRAYALAVLHDAARLGPGHVVAESLHFHGFRHGYHHERCFVQLGPVAELALSLCCCTWCERAAADAGIDIAVVRRWATDAARVDMSGEPSSGGELVRPLDPSVAPPEVEGFLCVREQLVTSLVADAAEAVRQHDARLVYLDPAGAAKGYADGGATGALAASTSWLWGIDPAAVASAADAIELLGYARSPERLAADLAAYVAASGDPRRVAVSLRPWLPDAPDATNLAAKLGAVVERGIDRIDVYHYGLVPLAGFDRWRAAVSSGARR